VAYAFRAELSTLWKRGANAYGVFGGDGCGMTTTSARGKTRMHVDVDYPKSALQREIARFREKASECTLVNRQNICKQLVDHYKALREKLIDEDPSIADKTIIARHYLNTCPYCISSQPIWASVMNEYLNGESNRKYHFIEIDESLNRTPGVKSVPTVVRLTANSISSLADSSVPYEKIKQFITGR